MNQEIYGASYIKNGSDIFEDQEDIIEGRVINVKFIRKNGDYFTIRSDYEPVYTPDTGGGKISFIRCSQKPSITVSYNQVAQGTAIEVKIQVDGLYIDREASGNEIDASQGNPVVWAIVQMGYIGQFYDWRNMMSDDSADRFFELSEDYATPQAGVKGGKQILVNVLTATPLNTPPDVAWVFNGVIGTLDAGLRWRHEESATTDPLYGNNDSANAKGRPRSEIEAMLYHWITRRFVSPSVLHTMEMKETKTDNGVTYTPVLKVYGYSSYKYQYIKDTAWTELTLASDGLMTFSDANMLGVQCDCSAFVQNSSIHELFSQGAPGNASAFVKCDQAVFDNPKDGVGPQLLAIQEHYPFLRWMEMRDGSFFFYDVLEGDSSIQTDPYVQERQVNAPMILPAVYDITMGATRTIRCPFFTFVDPLTTVFFQSRFRLVDSTAYWYQPKKGMDAFTVILSSVSFSTVGEENMMTLTCIDVPDGQGVNIDPANGNVRNVPTPIVVPDFTAGVQQKKESRQKTYARMSVIAGEPPYENVAVSWQAMARIFLMTDARAEDWPSGKPTIQRALTDLREWNSTGAGVWTDARMVDPDQGTSYDDTHIEGLSFHIPWLHDGDKVFFMYPYKESYATTFQQKDIKVSG